MRVHVLQHVAFEGLGSILSWLRSKNATVTTTQFFASWTIPALNEFELLIVLGGPMSVNDEQELPWLREEKRFVRESIQAGKAVTGICLGAQLMASSLGAAVYPASHKEIGWFDVYAVEHNWPSLVFPKQMQVFHWHGETFDLPAGAIHLAYSEACVNQAFQIGPRAIGLQFHLETTPESVDALVSNCRHELVPGKYVQSEQELRSVAPGRYATINALMASVLEYVTRSSP
jgi:GMP synthase-like glutamine amidotransferase